MLWPGIKVIIIKHTFEQLSHVLNSVDNVQFHGTVELMDQYFDHLTRRSANLCINN
jgi:hypothetical protein